MPLKQGHYALVSVRFVEVVNTVKLTTANELRINRSAYRAEFHVH